MTNTMTKTIQGFLLNKFLSWLSQIEKGRIHITFPDGKSFYFGEPYNNLETEIKIPS